jgi:hypothetical protein
MALLDDIKNISYAHHVVNMDFKDRCELFELGFWNETVNNSTREKPTDEVIEHAVFILSKYYGRLTKYALWECSVCGYRIVFGN